MRRIVIVLACFAAVSIAGESRLRGQTATASLTVNATVSKNCTITTAPVSFGPYDTVAANAAAPLDGIGTITVTCTKGAAAKVGLNTGSNAQGTTRRMSQGAAAFLNYEIYQDAARITVWGNGANDSLAIVAAPNRNPRNFTVYGRVPQAQDATVGTYADTVVATVNF
jgi:spore coat protein U-like protein